MRTPIGSPLPVVLVAITAAACAGPTSHGLGNNLLTPNDGYLSAPEMSADCNGLRAAMGTRAAQVKRLQADMATELKSPAPTIDRMIKRNDGSPGSGTIAYEQMMREKKAMATINAHLEAKHCPTIDVDVAIASATAAPAPAAAGAPVRKKS